MFERDKVLLTFDRKQHNGLVYPLHLAFEIVAQLKTKDVGGIVIEERDGTEYDLINKKDYQFKIENPIMKMDGDEVILVCDVHFLDKKVYESIKNKFWVLTIGGFGVITNGQVETIDSIESINIEIVDRSVYNEILNNVKGYK
jgi:hypothetical protein